MCCTNLEEQTMSGIALGVTVIVILILDFVSILVCVNVDSFFWSILSIFLGITVIIGYCALGGDPGDIIFYGFLLGGVPIISGCIKLKELIEFNKIISESKEKTLRQKKEKELNSINEETSKKRSLINKLKKKQEEVLLLYDEQRRNDFVNVNNNQIDG